MDGDFGAALREGAHFPPFCLPCRAVEAGPLTETSAKVLVKIAVQCFPVAGRPWPTRAGRSPLARLSIVASGVRQSGCAHKGVEVWCEMRERDVIVAAMYGGSFVSRGPDQHGFNVLVSADVTTNAFSPTV